MAKLIESIAISGSQKSDGTPNASGMVWVYVQGTTTLATVYADVEGDAPQTQPVTLDAAGRAVIYIDQVVTLHVETAAGVTVGDYDVADSPGVVLVQNAAFTGTLASGSQGAGGMTDLDTILTSAQTSFGGTDFKYQEAAGATTRNIGAWLHDVWISVRDYGAVGDGLVDDTAACQAASNRVAALGGGTVYFPPGSYVVSAAITVTSHASINFRGAGAASIILNSSAGGNAFTFTSCSDFTIEGLKVSHSSGSTGYGVSLVGCTNVTMRSVIVTASHARCVSVTGASAHTRIVDCYMTLLSGATNIGVYYNATGLHHSISGSTILPTSGGKLIDYDGATSYCTVDSCFFTQTANGGIVWESTLTGLHFDITNCPTLGQFAGALSPAFVTSLSVIPCVRQVNNELDGANYTLLSAGTMTPDFTASPEILITGTTTGSAYTINAPSILPHSTMRNFRVVVRYKCAAGVNITGWGTAAVYHHSAIISVTDTQTTAIIYLWDGTFFREIGRGITA